MLVGPVVCRLAGNRFAERGNRLFNPFDGCKAQSDEVVVFRDVGLEARGGFKALERIRKTPQFVAAEAEQEMQFRIRRISLRG